MTHFSLNKLTGIIVSLLLLLSCKKSDFLNAKPDQAMVVPSTIEDYQAILDEDNAMNGQNFGVTPGLGLLGSDDFFVTDAHFASGSQYIRNAYIWAKDIYDGTAIGDWAKPYRAIYYANTTLEGINKITPTASQQDSWNNIKGSALFYRAYMNYQLAQVFAPHYVASTAAVDLGLPLRIQSDVNESLERSSVLATYDLMLTDLKAAVPLLQIDQPYPTRPSKPAAFALLSKIYLVMQDYRNAYNYADSCLQLKNELIDYNTLNTASNTPFTVFNKEVLFHTTQSTVSFASLSTAKIDSAYSLYNNNDLRKLLFFRSYQGNYIFKGKYTDGATLFSGIANDEIYLTRAECAARLGKVDQAMLDLNNLLITRYKTNTYIPYNLTNADAALTLILNERRKQLLMRGTRWTDLRRLNLDPKFAKTLTCTVGSQTYTLPPNDLNYTLPIPDEVIALNPKIKQNERH